MIVLSNPGSVVYPQKFDIGDIAIAKKALEFSDGTKEEVGQRTMVTAKNNAYFNVCHQDYDKA